MKYTPKQIKRYSLSKQGILNPQYKQGLERFRSYNWLYQKYWVEKLSLSQIANIVKVNLSTIKKWMIKANIPRRKACVRSGHYHPRFKGFSINSQGYRLIYSPNHPNKSAGNYVREHILIAEKVLNRYLNKNEVIHHINGIRTDNRPENLYLFTKREHDRYEQLRRRKSKSFIPITQSNLSKNR